MHWMKCASDFAWLHVYNNTRSYSCLKTRLASLSVCSNIESQHFFSANYFVVETATAACPAL